MSSLAEIEEAIERLSPDQQRSLRDWMLSRCRDESDSEDDLLVPAAYRNNILDYRLT